MERKRSLKDVPGAVSWLWCWNAGAVEGRRSLRIDECWFLNLVLLCCGRCSRCWFLNSGADTCTLEKSVPIPKCGIISCRYKCCGKKETSEGCRQVLVCCRNTVNAPGCKKKVSGLFRPIFWPPAYTLKGPKREMFVAGIFTEIRPVWVGDLETRPKNLKSLCLGALYYPLFPGICFSAVAYK